MKNKIYLFILFIFIASCEKVKDDFQSMQMDFNKKILAGYFIKSIAFDTDGNAWIGTFKQGLIKYNSNGITVYNSSNSIIPDSSVIYDIAVDSKDNVWISCNGLIKYDGKDFIQYNSENTPIPEDFIGSIAIDSKDNVWFSSSRFRQGGFGKFDGQNWIIYTPENSELPVNFVQSIDIDNNDNVWIAFSEIVNDAYLIKISNENWTTYTSADLGFTPYYFGNIQVNSKNELCGAIDYSLSSTISNLGPQVFIFDGESAQQLEFDSISNLKFITIDNEDNIWCAGYGVLAFFDGENWSIDQNSFKENGIFAIEQSLDGNIWIGTGEGVYISD